MRKCKNCQMQKGGGGEGANKIWSLPCRCSMIKAANPAPIILVADPDPRLNLGPFSGIVVR
jgi:hypothetical protein